MAMAVMEVHHLTVRMVTIMAALHVTLGRGLYITLKTTPAKLSASYPKINNSIYYIQENIYLAQTY